jgi:hypothetical protein
MLLSPGQLWGLRAIALGAILVIAAIIGGLVSLGGGDDEDGGDHTQELQTSLVDPETGIGVHWPRGWAKLEKADKFAFQSPDKAVLVAISAPAPASQAAQVRRDVIAATAQQYRNPTIGRGSDRKFGGLESAGALISGRGPRGPSTTLVAVAPGATKAYLLEVYSASGASAEALAGAQLILNSLELIK